MENRPMQNTPPTPEQLLELWGASALPWADAVRGGGIESRRLCTDAAVINAVQRHQPQQVLDVGCGEGWLTRALLQRGTASAVCDAIPALVSSAQAAGGEFFVASFADLLAGPRHANPALATALWVCNFSLFHEHDAAQFLAAATRHLLPQGHVVIQTLHANAAQGCTEGSAPEGWQPGGWGSCGSGFGPPIAWYFRNTPSWAQLFAQAGFDAVQIEEPRHPTTGQALSYLLTARKKA
jgi:2-polyprenyl-3-methyl-5-hydroxy-6-metoxy-1,4-benzoquinol methylase